MADNPYDHFSEIRKAYSPGILAEAEKCLVDLRAVFFKDDRYVAECIDAREDLLTEWLFQKCPSIIYAADRVQRFWRILLFCPDVTPLKFEYTEVWCARIALDCNLLIPEHVPIYRHTSEAHRLALFSKPAQFHEGLPLQHLRDLRFHTLQKAIAVGLKCISLEFGPDVEFLAISRVFAFALCGYGLDKSTIERLAPEHVRKGFLEAPPSFLELSVRLRLAIINSQRRRNGRQDGRPLIVEDGLCWTHVSLYQQKETEVPLPVLDNIPTNRADFEASFHGDVITSSKAPQHAVDHPASDVECIAPVLATCPPGLRRVLDENPSGSLYVRDGLFQPNSDGHHCPSESPAMPIKGYILSNVPYFELMQSLLENNHFDVAAGLTPELDVLSYSPVYPAIEGKELPLHLSGGGGSLLGHAYLWKNCMSKPWKDRYLFYLDRSAFLNGDGIGSNRFTKSRGRFYRIVSHDISDVFLFSNDEKFLTSDSPSEPERELLRMHSYFLWQMDELVRQHSDGKYFLVHLEERCLMQTFVAGLSNATYKLHSDESIHHNHNEVFESVIDLTDLKKALLPPKALMRVGTYCFSDYEDDTCRLDFYFYDTSKEDGRGELLGSFLLNGNSYHLQSFGLQENCLHEIVVVVTFLAKAPMGTFRGVSSMRHTVGPCESALWERLEDESGKRLSREDQRHDDYVELGVLTRIKTGAVGRDLPSVSGRSFFKLPGRFAVRRKDAPAENEFTDVKRPPSDLWKPIWSESDELPRLQGYAEERAPLWEKLLDQSYQQVLREMNLAVKVLVDLDQLKRVHLPRSGYRTPDMDDPRRLQELQEIQHGCLPPMCVLNNGMGGKPRIPLPGDIVPSLAVRDFSKTHDNNYKSEPWHAIHSVMVNCIIPVMRYKNDWEGIHLLYSWYLANPGRIPDIEFWIGGCGGAPMTTGTNAVPLARSDGSYPPSAITESSQDPNYRHNAVMLDLHRRRGSAHFFVPGPPF